MNSKTLYLDKIYDYVSKNREIPHRTNDAEVYKGYKRIIIELIEGIPEEPGWFTWIGNEGVLYNGAAAKSLHLTIENDLLKNYVPFWAKVDPDVVDRMTEKYDGKYRSNHERTYLRKGVTSIVWGIHTGGESVDNAQPNLISESKPCANTKKKKQFAEMKTSSDHRNIGKPSKDEVSPSESGNSERDFLEERIDSSTDVMTPAELYKKVINSVVAIETSGGSGSGILISPNGIIVTNRHVAQKTSKLLVQLNNGVKYVGSVIRACRDMDIAFIKIEIERCQFQPIKIPTKLENGLKVWAIGHPLDLNGVITEGLIGCAEYKNDGKTYLQHSADISPGNSGGPLFSMPGNLIAINTMGFTKANSLYLAIPIGEFYDQFKIIEERISYMVNNHYCPTCGNTSYNRIYCEYCGVKIADGSLSFFKLDNSFTKNCRNCEAVFDDNVEHCPNCASSVKQEEFSMQDQDYIGMVDDFFRKININPEDVRKKEENVFNWHLMRGSAAVYIYLFLHEGEARTIRIVSPIVFIPQKNILPLYRRCLEINLELINCALCAMDDKIAVVHERPTDGLVPEELDSSIQYLSSVADDLDDRLSNEFGALVYTKNVEQLISAYCIAT